MNRLEGLQSSHAGHTTGGAASPGDGTTAPAPDENRKAEIEWLKRETDRIKTEIEKTRIEIASRPTGTGPGPGPGPDPDATTPLPLTPADVGAAIDRILQKRWEDGKLREAEAKIAILERNAANELSNLGNRIQLDAAEKSKLEAILKSQVDGYAAILRKLPVPEDRQAQLDKVTAEAEAQIGQALTGAKAEEYKKKAGNWHGFSQKVDPKRDPTQPGPRK